MKHVTIKTREYEDAVYPAVALARPTTTEEIHNALAVKSKLEEVGIPKPQTDSAKDQGLPQMYVLPGEDTRLSFEDAEAGWLQKTLSKAIENQMFITATAGLALAFRDRLEKASGEIGQNGVSETRKAEARS